MALVSDNVRVAVTGTLSVGPTGTTAPTDGSAALAAGFVDLGYIGEDGVTETRDRTTETIRGWQNGDTLREVVTEANLTYTCVLLETKREVVELFYGGTVDTTDGGIPIVPAKTGGRKAFVLDIADGDEFVRVYLPSAEITEVGDQVYASGEAIGYEVTIRAYPDATITDAGGNTGAAMKWFSDLVVPVA